jgi:hypothetical protein
MCRRRLVTYTCPEPCGFTLPFWKTHCHYTDRDNIQGACGQADDVGLRVMNHACSLHSGLSDRNLSGPVILQDGTVNMWKYDSPRRRDLLCERWVRNGDLYEKDADMPASMDDMNRARWLAYNENIVNRARTTDLHYGGSMLLIRGLWAMRGLGVDFLVSNEEIYRDVMSWVE